MVFSGEKNQTWSDSQVIEMIHRVFMSKTFNEKLDEFISNSIVKGKYDEAISIRQRIVRGRFVIA